MRILTALLILAALLLPAWAGALDRDPYTGVSVWIGGDRHHATGVEVSVAVPAKEQAPFSFWVTHSLANVFRDTAKPARAARRISLLAAGGEYEAGQVVLVPEREATVRAWATPLEGAGGRIPAHRVQCRWVGYKWVEKNSKALPPEYQVHPAPAFFPDELLEEASVALKPGENQPLLVTVQVPRGTKAGKYQGKVWLQAGASRVEVPLAVEVLPFSLPEKPSLLVTNWFNVAAMAEAHGVRLYSEEFWPVLRAYARDMAAHRQNVAMVPPDLVDVYIEADGSLTFDFPRFDRWVRTFEEAGCAERLEIMHMGGRTTGDWECPTFSIGKRPALVRATGERRDIEIEEFLPGLVRHLKGKGWLEKSMLHIADEPIPVNVESWQQASRRVHAAAAELRRIDAIHVPGLPGDLEVWVPQLNFFDDYYQTFHQAQRDGICELWFYTAWVPQGKFPNRLMDMPLVNTRVLHWINYLWGATGYLHWGLNWWNLDFGHFSPGDEWIIYPGKRGPRSSLRWEAMRDGLEDYEYFRLLEAKRGPERAQALGRQLVRAITDFDRDPDKLLRIRRQMAGEIGS